MSASRDLSSLAPGALEVMLKVESLYTLRHHFQSYPRPDAAHSPTPQLAFEVTPRYSLRRPGYYEVVLALELKARQGEALFFEMGLEQAGLFQIEDLSPGSEPKVLYGLCPQYLFPYANVWINQTLTQAGLPPIYLTPLDFLALYGEYQQENTGKVFSS